MSRRRELRARNEVCTSVIYVVYFLFTAFLSMHAHVERELNRASSSSGVGPGSRAYRGSPTAHQGVRETCSTRPQRVASRGDQFNVL